MTYQNLYTQLLEQYEAGEAAAIARWAAEEVLHLSLTDIYMGKDKNLSAEQRLRWEETTSRLLQGEPIQYVLGYADFCGHRFCVSNDTLIPRPETEDLVDLLIRNAEQLPPRYADLGTGTGCIAISLKHALPNSEVRACDISSGAVSIAIENSQRLATDVCFKVSDMLSEDFCNDFIPTVWHHDYVLVTNPPYICDSEQKDMEAHVLDYEPSTALFVPDEDPLRYYRAVAQIAAATHPFAVAAEINTALGSQTAELFAAVGYTHTQILNDRYGRPRMLWTSIHQ